MTWGVTTRGIDGLNDLARLEPNLAPWLSQEVNRVTRSTRTRVARQVLAEANLPTGYVAPRNRRLQIVQNATPRNPEAIIEAEGRATSLTRYVISTSGQGLAVNIRGGGVRRFRRAFQFRGRTDATTDTGSGGALFALRVRKGTRLRGSYAARQVDDTLYLLFGPSVAQIVLANDGTGVFRDVEEPTADLLELRFLQRLTREGF